MSIFETIGIAYTVLATTFFTIELIYCTVKGVNNLRHLLDRGQGGPERRGSGQQQNESRENILVRSTHFK
jgi:hypothetical protein